MKAVRVKEHGGPEVLVLEDLATPEPGPGQALVRVEASGVNYFDIRQRTGDFKAPLPLTLGNEGAGVVDSVGPGTDGIHIGDRVAWQMQQGSYATHSLVPSDALVPLPDTISTRDAAAVMLQGLTAHALACSAYPLAPGSTCLVHSAAGGLGGLLTQIAKARGARVIGTVSRSDKVDAALEVGADDVVVYTEANLAESVRRLTDGRGVDVVYDGVGRETFLDGLEALRPLGYMVLFGQSSGAVAPFDTHHLSAGGGRYLTRAAVGQYVTDRDSLLTAANEIFDWITTGALRIRHAGTYPLDGAADAHRALSSRRVIGKLLLEPVP
jgi:NADPH:quinone reductase